MGASAQLNLDQIKYGVKAGINVSSISNDSDIKSKVGLNLGVFAEYAVNDIFGIRPEIVYSQQGFRYKDTDYKESDRLNYLNIPILAKLYLPNGFSIELGPQFGFLLAANAKWEDKSSGTTESGTDSFSEYVNKFDFAAAIGASYEFNSNISVSARYNLGLSNINKDNNLDTNKNRVLQIGVNYSF